jgi:hypothetical protein
MTGTATLAIIMAAAPVKHIVGEPCMAQTRGVQTVAYGAAMM